MRHSFSRSYGVILPSSLTRVLSSALVFSTYLPVSVLVRMPSDLARGFSRQCGINQFAAVAAPYHLLRLNEETDLPISSL